MKNGSRIFAFLGLAVIFGAVSHAQNFESTEFETLEVQILLSAKTNPELFNQKEALNELEVAYLACQQQLKAALVPTECFAYEKKRVAQKIFAQAPKVENLPALCDSVAAKTQQTVVKGLFDLPMDCRLKAQRRIEENIYKSGKILELSEPDEVRANSVL